MLLGDLVNFCSNLWTAPPPVPRTAERLFLTVPIHEHVDHQYRQEQIQAVFAKAA
jgi:hypothetical protein